MVRRRDEIWLGGWERNGRRGGDLGRRLGRGMVRRLGGNG